MSDREQFEAAMVAAGYNKPERGQGASAQYLYQRDEDRFVGWSLATDVAALTSAPAEPDAYNRRLRAQLEQEWADLQRLKNAYTPAETPPAAGAIELRERGAGGVSAAQAIEALDELAASARGDEPFNHFAAPLIRSFIEGAAGAIDARGHVKFDVTLPYLQERLQDHTCTRVENAGGTPGLTLYKTKLSADKEYQLYDTEAFALWFNLGKALAPILASREEAPEMRPVQASALAQSVAELDAWMDRADGEPLTPSESESVMLVLHELKRLRATPSATPLEAPTAAGAAQEADDRIRASAYKYCFKAYEMPAQGEQLYLFDLTRIKLLHAALAATPAPEAVKPHCGCAEQHCRAASGEGVAPGLVCRLQIKAAQPIEREDGK